MTIGLAILAVSASTPAHADGPWLISSGTLEVEDTYSNTVTLATSDDDRVLTTIDLTADNVDTGKTTEGTTELIYAVNKCTARVVGQNIYGGSLFEHHAILEFYFTGVHTYPWTETESHQAWLGWSFHHMTDVTQVTYNVEWTTTYHRLF